MEKIVKESFTHRISKKKIGDIVANDIPMDALTFVEAFRKYVEESDIIRPNGIIVDENHRPPYFIKTDWRKNEGGFCSFVFQIFPYSYHFSRPMDIPVIDFDINIAKPVNNDHFKREFRDNEVSVGILINNVKEQRATKNGCSYHVPILHLNFCGGKFLFVMEDFKKQVPNMEIEDMVSDSNVILLNNAKKWVDNLKRLLESETMKGILYSDDGSESEIPFNEKVKNIFGFDFKRLNVNESFTKKIAKKTVGDVADELAKQTFNPSIEPQEFIRRLNDTVIGFKEEWANNPKKSPQRDFYKLEWETITAWPNMFAYAGDVNKKDYPRFELLFDISNSKKSKLRIKFTIHTYTINKFGHSKKSKYDGRSGIVAYFEIGDHDDNMYQYTFNNRKQRLELKNTGNGCRFPGIKDIFEPNEKNLRILVNDIKCFIENHKLWYKTYLKQSYYETINVFLNTLPSSKKELIQESFTRKTANKSLNDVIKNQFTEMNDFKEFDDLMKNFIKKETNGFQKVKVSKFPPKRDSGSIFYVLSKIKNCPFGKTVTKYGATLDETKISFELNVWQNGIFLYGDEELDTTLGILTPQFCIKMGPSTLQNITFDNIDFCGEDFKFTEFKERREWEKPNFSYEFLNGFCKFVKSVDKTVDEMSEECWKEIGVTSSEFFPIPGESCRKIDSDSVTEILSKYGFYDKLHKNFKNQLSESFTRKVTEKSVSDLRNDADNNIFEYTDIVKDIISTEGYPILYGDVLSFFDSTKPITEKEYQSLLKYEELGIGDIDAISTSNLFLGELKFFEEVDSEERKIICYWRQWRPNSKRTGAYLKFTEEFKNYNKSQQKIILDYLKKRFMKNESFTKKIKGFDFDSMKNKADETFDVEILIQELLKKKGTKERLFNGKECIYILEPVNFSSNGSFINTTLNADLNKAFDLGAKDGYHKLLVQVIFREKSDGEKETTLKYRCFDDNGKFRPRRLMRDVTEGFMDLKNLDEEHKKNLLVFLDDDKNLSSEF